VTDSIDLTVLEIPEAINGAYDRGNPIVVGYTDDEGRPSLSVRGSVHVHSSTQIALWARSATGGMVEAIASRPEVSLLFFGSSDAGPRMLLSVLGRARVDASANDEVYNAIIPSERNHDPEKKGVAVIVDVHKVSGFSPEIGSFSQQR